MTPHDRPAFLAVLSRTFRMQQKPLPDPELLDVWWLKLEAHPLEAVARAFSRHLDESEFAPTPAAILKHLPKQSDGRPEVDEAWAIALRSRDERDTVVWTDEIAEAWSVAQSVIDGDEIGARMAFKAAYLRITEQSRGVNRPVQWIVSQGFDAARREEVVAHAVREGRLMLAHAQAAVPMLAGPDGGHHGTNVEANLARLKAIVAGVGSAKARATAAKSRHAREDAEQLADAKQAAASRVAAYEASHA
jgi:hypothetical protein